MYKFIPIILILMLLLQSCQTPAPKEAQPVVDLTSSQIKQLQNFDELRKLLQRVNTALAGKDPQSHAEDYAKKAQIEAQLANISITKLEQTFTENRLETGEVPMSILNPRMEYIQGITEVSEEKWQPVIDRINSEVLRTQSAVEQEKEKLTASQSDREQLDHYDRLHILSGDTQWLEQKNQKIEQMITDIRTAQASGNLDEDVQSKIALVKAQRGDDAQLMDELISVDAKIYEDQFFAALSEGNPDKAFTVFESMSKTHDFDKYKAKLADTSQRMSDLFVAMADDSVKTPGNLPQSYRWYAQARIIRSEFGVQYPNREGEKELIEQLRAKYRSADEKGNHGMALAYIYMADDLRAAGNDFRKELQDAENKVRQQAVKKVSTTEFENSATQHDYSDVVTANITQYIFQQLPHDVRIVEREQYEAILRERELGKDAEGLSAVDLLITGTVQDSKVDTSKSTGKKMLRVSVGKETIPNPAYISWLEKPSKERDKIEKPSDTIEVDKQENVSITASKHRKVGIFSVNYRLVEPSTGKVLFPDTIRKDSQFEDDSSDGIEMGDTIIPAKLADLPSDIEILDKLAKQVSEEIGAKLVEQLKDQDLRYLAEADKQANANNCEREVEAVSKAISIMENKSMDISELRKRLQTSALKCTY